MNCSVYSVSLMFLYSSFETRTHQPHTICVIEPYFLPPPSTYNTHHFSFANLRLYWVFTQGKFTTTTTIATKVRLPRTVQKQGKSDENGLHFRDVYE